MIFSRHIYWTILLRILLILATSGTGLWLIISQRGIIIGTLLIICSLFQIGGIVTYLNNINRKLRLFFDAIEDRDNTFSYPEQGINEEQQQLNRSLNRINALLAQTKMDYQKQEHFYRSLLEKVPNGIIAWNNSKKIIFVNNTALTLLNIESLTLYSQLENILQNEKNRKRLSLSQSQMKLQDETITLLSIQDIDDRLNENEKGIRGLHIIQAQSERLMEFTESFRHLSYLPQPEKRLFSLSDLLHNLEELLQTNFQENNISFTLRCSPEPMMTEGDEKQLSQVFLNLLKNAMQALEGHPHGELSLQAEQDEHIVIDITDNGPGIPPEIMDKVFIPFFTTKSEGTGIGLSLCKEIIRRHEGHLAIKESRAGKTVFHIELP